MLNDVFTAVVRQNQTADVKALQTGCSPEMMRKA
jgi:hypothetical protein